MTNVGHYEGAKRVVVARQKCPLPRRQWQEPWAASGAQLLTVCDLGQFSPLLWASVSTCNPGRVCILNSLGEKDAPGKVCPPGTHPHTS